MYSSYSTLQRKQLTKQVYTDTQSTYLLVYAPGRHQALEHAMENQLHRKFRLVTELAPALTDSVEGVLLVSEDLECTSTALTYFAAALRTGADFVVCDAAFGFDGSTALYLSTQHIPCSRCAMVSRKLLDRVRAAAPCHRHGGKLPPHPAVFAALPAGAMCRRCVLCLRKACSDPEPRADHDRCAHRADKCRAGAAQHGL